MLFNLRLKKNDQIIILRRGKEGAGCVLLYFLIVVSIPRVST